MFGVTIAFENDTMFKGVFRSPWAGFPTPIAIGGIVCRVVAPSCGIASSAFRRRPSGGREVTREGRAIVEENRDAVVGVSRRAQHIARNAHPPEHGPALLERDPDVVLHRQFDASVDRLRPPFHERDGRLCASSTSSGTPSCLSSWARPALITRQLVERYPTLMMLTSRRGMVR